MPLRIGTVALTARERDSLRLIFTAKESRSGPSTQGPPSHCAGMQPKFFVAGPGRGTVKHAFVAMVVKPIDVWRAWSDKPAFCSQAMSDGRWWSLDDPRKLGKAGYRVKAGICESWNTLTRVKKCALKAGAVIAIGPTESVGKKTCACTARDRVTYGDKVNEAYDPTLAKYARHDHHSKKDPARLAYDDDDSSLQVFIDSKGKLPAISSSCQDFVWK